MCTPINTDKQYSAPCCLMSLKLQVFFFSYSQMSNCSLNREDVPRWGSFFFFKLVVRSIVYMLHFTWGEGVLIDCTKKHTERYKKHRERYTRWAE